MTVDPFLRLALIVCATAYVVALAVVQRWLGWPAATVAAVVGVAGAALLTVEVTHDTRVADRDRLLHRLRFRPERQRELRRRGEL